MLSHPAASKGPRTVPGWSAPPEVPPESFTPSILSADPPDRTRMRGLMNRSFTPGRVDGLRPRMLFAETSLNEAVERRSRAVWLSAVRRISWGHIQSSLKQVRSSGARFLLSCADRDRATRDGDGVAELVAATSTRA